MQDVGLSESVDSLWERESLRARVCARALVAYTLVHMFAASVADVCLHTCMHTPWDRSPNPSSPASRTCMETHTHGLTHPLP